MEAHYSYSGKLFKNNSLTCKDMYQNQETDASSLCR